MRLDGKRAFITGAARGLGHAIAVALHEAGATVVLADIHEDVSEVARLIGGSGARAHAVQLNVRDAKQFRDVFERVSKDVGAIDIMVNNAARTVLRPIWDIQVEEWDEVLATNLRSVFLGCQLAGARMKEAGWGRIINISSIAGQQASRVAGAHYAASKAGIISVTKNFALALAGSGVTVNVIAPSSIDGPMLRSAVKPEQVPEMARSIPVGRIGRPEEVGFATAFLASELSSYITGATLDMNGGSLMR